jgi:hypothetical protein
MKLRSGKTIGSTETSPKTVALVNKFKSLLIEIDRVPKTHVPGRIRVCYDIISLFSNNLEFIVTPEFSTSPKFIKVIYNKTYELEDDVYHSLDRYITDNQLRRVKSLDKMADELYFLLLKVRQDIEKHLPELKPKNNNDLTSYCTCCPDE